MRSIALLSWLLAACGGVCEVASADVAEHRALYVPERVEGGRVESACRADGVSAEVDVVVRYRLGAGFSVPAGPWTWRVEVRDGRVVEREQVSPADTGAED
jgi:hypothetical protein